MKAITEIMENHQAVEFAHLFGSAAMGIEGNRSDLDIAFYLNDTLPVQEMGQCRLELAELLEQKTDRKIDLVILNTASLKLIHQVLAHGRLLYAKDPQKEMDFAIKKRKEYFDFKYYIDRDLQEMRAFYKSYQLPGEV